MKRVQLRAGRATSLTIDHRHRHSAVRICVAVHHWPAAGITPNRCVNSKGGWWIDRGDNCDPLIN